MMKEKDEQQTDEIEKTKVMPLSSFSTKTSEKDKQKTDESTKETIEEKQNDVETINEDNVSDIEECEQKELKVDKEVIGEAVSEVESDKDTEKEEKIISDNSDNTKIEEEHQDAEEHEEVVKNDIESEPEIATDEKREDIKEDLEASSEDSLKQKEENEVDESKEVEQEKKYVKLTLEEKRKAEREKLMTIEERRNLQKEGKLPIIEKDKKKLSDSMGKVDYAILILSMAMSWFVSYRVYSYFSWGYALAFFLSMHALFAGIFYVSLKKRKIGLGLNIGMSTLMVILSLLMFKVNNFTNQILDNSESEMVMLVAKKDSTITEKDDFKDKKIAFIKSDGDTNTFAKEMLSEAKKEAYEETVYITYKEAYEALINDDIDMMVYTSFTKQRLAEDDIQSWDEIKVILQKSRALKAVESKTVDISKDPFNIYISGVDLTSYSINEKGSSDVNIIMTVNPQTKKIIMQTIPRDTWAGLSCSNGEHTKLTYAGAYGGIDCSIKTIEDYIGVEINYYAKINFQGVIDLVDALGGITVNSNASFCESHPLEGYGVKNYCYNAGANTLNGIDALMFARIRKVFSDGDVERGRHQMEVVNAVIRKFSESPSLGNINALLGAVENNFTTNLKEDDIGKGLELFLALGNHLTSIETETMSGEFIWKTDEVSNEYLYYFIPNDGQVDLVKQRIQDVMDGK